MNDELYNKLYNDIKEFRAAFNLPINNIESYDLQLHESLLLEEMEELAFAETDIQRLDAIVDSVYVRIGTQVNVGIGDIDPLIDALYKLALQMNFNFEKAWNIIHASNMSKLCVSYEEAEQSVDAYIKQGYAQLQIAQVENYFTVTNNENVILPVGKFVGKGKTLKSINYTKPDLSECV